MKVVINNTNPSQEIDFIQELELLIKSRYPIIYLETWEEERAENILEIIARNLKIFLFIWKSTKGLFRLDLKDPIYNTINPLQALSHMYSPDFPIIKKEKKYSLFTFKKGIEILKISI